jgi:Tfp pilus assembly protein PilF
LSPEFSEGRFQLGRAILETGVDLAGAIREFRGVLNVDPERADAHYQIGLALLKLDQRGSALEELRIAAEMAPCRVEVMLALARAAIEAGDLSTGIRQLRRVVAWDPENRDARVQLGSALASEIQKR